MPSLRLRAIIALLVAPSLAAAQTPPAWSAFTKTFQAYVDSDRVVMVEMRHASVGMTNARAREVFRHFTEIAPRVRGVTSAATSIASSFGLGWGIKPIDHARIAANVAR
jgi:hypothetical protein